MAHLAVLTPAVLLLLMVLLGRLEGWLEESTTPPPPKAHGHRWRRRTRRAWSGTLSEVGAARGLLAHRTRTIGRRRAATPPRTAVAVPRPARRARSGTRLRTGR